MKISSAAQGDYTINKLLHLITIEELKRLYKQNKKDKCVYETLRQGSGLLSN